MGLVGAAEGVVARQCVRGDHYGTGLGSGVHREERAGLWVGAVVRGDRARSVDEVALVVEETVVEWPVAVRNNPRVVNVVRVGRLPVGCLAEPLAALFASELVPGVQLLDEPIAVYVDH